jgi:hypothetical protein
LHKTVHATLKNVHDTVDEQRFATDFKEGLGGGSSTQDLFLGGQSNAVNDPLDQEVGRVGGHHHHPERIAPILRDSILMDGNSEKEDKKMHQAIIFPEDFGTEKKLRAVKDMDSATGN